MTTALPQGRSDAQDPDAQDLEEDDLSSEVVVYVPSMSRSASTPPAPSTRSSASSAHAPASPRSARTDLIEYESTPPSSLSRATSSTIADEDLRRPASPRIMPLEIEETEMVVYGPQTEEEAEAHRQRRRERAYLARLMYAPRRPRPDPEMVESLQARSDALNAELMEAIRVFQQHFPPVDYARLRKQAEDRQVAEWGEEALRRYQLARSSSGPASSSGPTSSSDASSLSGPASSSGPTSSSGAASSSGPASSSANGAWL